MRPASATDELHERFVRGRTPPKGVVWFGVRSVLGAPAAFIASAIATEDIVHAIG